MSKTSEFLNAVDDARIAAAIQSAESRSSCEFRVVVSRRRAPDPVAAATEKFVDLGMHATKLRNAVLIYVAPSSRTFALYADTVIGLAELRVATLLPGHGEPVLSGAAAQIERAAASFRRLVPPPNVLTD